MITELLFLSISYKRLNDCRKSSALCNAPLRGWHSRAELLKERNVLCGEALQCLTASGAKPQGTPAVFLLVMVIGNDSSMLRTLQEISHLASILCRFATVIGHLISKRQTVQIVLHHFFLNCLLSDSASPLSCRCLEVRCSPLELL